MATRTFPKMPTVSSVVTAYASVSAFVMIFRTMFEQLVPPPLRNYAIDLVKHYWKPRSSELILLFEEKDGYNLNEMFSATEVYLATKINRDSKRLRISKLIKEKHINIKLAESEEIVDSFEGVKVTWKYCSQQQKQKGDYFMKEKKYLELKLDNNKKNIIIDSYLPFIIERSQEIKIQKKAVELHNLRSPQSRHSDFKQTMNLNHPSTFETLAMDQKLKKEIMDDLDRFVKRKDYYERVRKAWKRGYLLYGPPRTGKSSLIAAMANHLKFDIFDLQLTNVKDDSSLKEILLETTNRSILVIEDIDCSIVLDRKEPSSSGESRRDDPKVYMYY
ncbi:AAA+ ATPase domain-containing protein [Tanacetum coccineum]